MPFNMQALAGGGQPLANAAASSSAATITPVALPTTPNPPTASKGGNSNRGANSQASTPAQNGIASTVGRRADFSDEIKAQCGYKSRLAAALVRGPIDFCLHFLFFFAEPQLFLLHLLAFGPQLAVQVPAALVGDRGDEQGHSADVRGVQVVGRAPQARHRLRPDSRPRVSGGGGKVSQKLNGLDFEAFTVTKCKNKRTHLFLRN